MYMHVPTYTNAWQKWAPLELPKLAGPPLPQPHTQKSVKSNMEKQIISTPMHLDTKMTAVLMPTDMTLDCDITNVHSKFCILFFCNPPPPPPPPPSTPPSKTTTKHTQASTQQQLHTHTHTHTQRETST